MYTGPHIIKDGLVFGYDTGYGIADNDTATRFYTGEPAVNLWDSLLSTQSLRSHTKHYWNGKKWTEDATYTHPGVDGPKDVYLGLVFKHVSGALNSTWSGTSYGYMLRDIACTNGATMTMSSWIYASGDCNVDSIPAVIEGESGGESTVTGYPASYDLNNKGTWQVTAKKATSDGNTRFIPLYPRKNGVTDGSFTGFFMWALPQVTYGDRVVTPIQPGATRSSTASLIDLKETTDIDVSNVSFDSTGQPDFDGSDDKIVVPNQISTGSYTYETVVKISSSDSSYSGFGSNFKSDSSGYSGVGNGWVVRLDPNGSLQIYTKNNSTTLLNPINISGFRAANVNKYIHLVYTYSSGTNKLYLNGVLQTTGTGLSGTTPSDSTLIIGAYSWGISSQTYYINAHQPIAKLYNQTHTATEIKQNFNAYKNRFDI